jgi:hypothetical protein
MRKRTTYHCRGGGGRLDTTPAVSLRRKKEQESVKGKARETSEMPGGSRHDTSLEANDERQTEGQGQQ